MSQSGAPDPGVPRDLKESKVEVAKRGSHRLRGTIAETLKSDATHFQEDDVHLLKFHGIYQQEDRAARTAARRGEGEKVHRFMVRVAIPGGVLDAGQYLELDALADDHAGGSLRATSREGLQFHGVIKGDLKRLIQGIHRRLLTTLSACGDAGRNVTVTPAPLAEPAYAQLRQLAREIASQLRPASRAYHEIWLDEERFVTTEDGEPFYGETYLPRKFKTGITLASDNSVDIYSDDCGLVAVPEDGRIRGFNVFVGGGMGMTHRHADTFASLAEPLGFVRPEHAVEAVKTVAAIFRDHGNRADRRHARLKYIIAEWGLERFREEFKRRASFELGPPAPLAPSGYRDYLGKHAQGDGRWCYGVFLDSGRIIDSGRERRKSGLRAVVGRHRPGVRLTPSQNMLLTDLEEEAIPDIEKTLRDHGMALVEDLSAARRYSMACPALPTCGLALSEAERVLPDILGILEPELEALGLRDVPIAIRMTGCPNGCARPYTADLAFVGRRPDVYNIYVGGGLGGDRVVDLYAADVPAKEILKTLRPLFGAWARGRGPDEGLGDFYQRLLARAEPRRKITGKEEPTIGLLRLEEAP